MTIRKTKSLDGVLGAAHLLRIAAECTPLGSIGNSSRNVAEEPWLQQWLKEGIPSAKFPTSRGKFLKIWTQVDYIGIIKT